MSFFIDNKIIVNISLFISYTADIDDTTNTHSDNNSNSDNNTTINTHLITPKQLEPLSFKNPFPASPASLKSKTACVSSSPPFARKYTFILSNTIPREEHTLLKQIISLHLLQTVLDMNTLTTAHPDIYALSHIAPVTSSTTQCTLSVKYIYDCYYSGRLIELNDTAKRKYTLQQI